MRKLLGLLLITGMLTAFAGCSKEKQLERWLIGTWDITKGTLVMTDGTNIALNNPGYVNFREDKTGTLTFKLSSSRESAQEFSWSNTGENVNVVATGQNASGSIEVKESSKTRQVWLYKDADNNAVTLEMSKRAE